MAGRLREWSQKGTPRDEIKGSGARAARKEVNVHAGSVPNGRERLGAENGVASVLGGDAATDQTAGQAGHVRAGVSHLADGVQVGDDFVVAVENLEVVAHAQAVALAVSGEPGARVEIPARDFYGARPLSVEACIAMGSFYVLFVVCPK